MFIRSGKATARCALLAIVAASGFYSSLVLAQSEPPPPTSTTEPPPPTSTTTTVTRITLKVGAATTTTSSTGVTTASVPVTWLSYPDATSYVLNHYSDTAGTLLIGSLKFISSSRASLTPIGGLSTYYSRIVANGSAGKLSESSLVRIAIPAPAPSTTWTLISGKARDVGVGGTGTWIVGTGAMPYGYAVWRLVNNAWSAVASTGATRIDVDAGGLPWIVDGRGALLRYGAGWTQVGTRASDIGVGANGTLWMIGNVAEGANFGIHRGVVDPKGGVSWTKMAGSAVRVDVDALGNAWVVNAGGAVYRWNGTGWTNVPGVAGRDVGIGADGAVFVTGTDNMTYRWNGGTGWDKRTGAGNSISVDATGVPLLVDSAGAIYKGWK